MDRYEFRIHVYLSGDTRMLLCTVYTADAVGAILAALCGAAKPHYARIEVEIGPMSP